MSLDYDYPPSLDPDPSDRERFYEPPATGSIVYPVVREWKCIWCKAQRAPMCPPFCSPECEARYENQSRKLDAMFSEVQARHAARSVETLREGIL